MRKAMLIAAVLLGCIAPSTQAGPATVNPNGDFGVVDFDVSPPVAGAESMTIRYQAFFGNRNGERVPANQSTRIRLPRGSRSNGPFFPQCRLPRTAAEVGSQRCRSSARIGRGTFEADARPTVATPVTGTLEVFNGEPVADTPSVIFLATAQVGGSIVRSELDFALRTLNGTPELVDIPPPEGTATGLFSVTRIDVIIGRTIRQRAGRRRITTGLLVPPRTCRGTWRFEEIATLPDGRGTITARDDVPCVTRR